MTENNNEIILTISKKKYILVVVLCIFLIAIGMIAILDGDFNYSVLPGLIGGAIGGSLSQFSRIKRIKKSIIDTDKYFDFKGEIKTSVIIFSVLILVGILFKRIFIKVLFMLIVILGVCLFILSTINYFKKKPVVIINDYGIKDDFNIFSPKVDMLKWGEVKEVFKYEDAAGKAIGILPQNMKNILGHGNWFTRFLIGNPKILTIYQRQISMDINDLYIEIKTRLI